jgi:hypothetical protein
MTRSVRRYGECNDFCNSGRFGGALPIVSPHEAQRKALRALRAYGETEALPPAVVAKTSQDLRGIFSHRSWWNHCCKLL